ncbi:hypothetical protein D3C78_1894140 [compost metagenome]
MFVIGRGAGIQLFILLCQLADGGGPFLCAHGALKKSSISFLKLLPELQGLLDGLRMADVVGTESIFLGLLLTNQG